MKTSQSSQLVSILLLFLIIVGTVVFVLPMRGDIASLEAQESTLNSELSSLDHQYEELSALSKEVSQSQTTKQKLLSAVPVGLEQDALILELTDLASQTGFSLSSLSFSDGQNPDFGGTLTVATSVKGTFDEMVEFLQLIESADRLMRVTSLGVQRLSSSDVTFSLTIESYYQ